MSINKNDCRDCINSIKLTSLRDDNYLRWLCNKGHCIPQKIDGIVEVLDEDCPDFGYSE